MKNLQYFLDHLPLYPLNVFSSGLGPMSFWAIDIESLHSASCLNAFSIQYIVESNTKHSE